MIQLLASSIERTRALSFVQQVCRTYFRQSLDSGDVPDAIELILSLGTLDDELFCALDRRSTDELLEIYTSLEWSKQHLPEDAFSCLVQLVVPGLLHVPQEHEIGWGREQFTPFQVFLLFSGQRSHL